MNRSPNDLVRLAMAGAGFRISASQYSIDSLVRIATAAKPDSQIIISDLAGLQIDDLVRIAMAGNGRVFFEE